MLWGSRLGGLLGGGDHYWLFCSLGESLSTRHRLGFSELPQSHPLSLPMGDFVSPCIGPCVLTLWFCYCSTSLRVLPMPSQAVLIHLSAVGIITTASFIYHSFQDHRKTTSSYLRPQWFPGSVTSLVRAVGKELWKGRQKTNSRLCVSMTWGRAPHSLGLRLVT